LSVLKPKESRTCALITPSGNPFLLTVYISFVDSLAVLCSDGLVSRSQAKRLLARFEVFREVILDFAGVASIGQAFADEVFRVFQNAHPEVHLRIMHASEEVLRMINRAKALRSSYGAGG
jgi:hypothetical protein